MDTNSVDVTQNLRRRCMSYLPTVQGVLLREYGPRRYAAKLLARDAGGVSPRTAQNWLLGICAPRGEELMTLMRECQALRAEIIRLTAKEGE